MDEEKYAVYVVIVEDTNRGFEQLSDAAAEGPTPIASELSWDEALELTRSIEAENR